mgnify:CR=1 FL=1
MSKIAKVKLLPINGKSIELQVRTFCLNLEVNRANVESMQNFVTRMVHRAKGADSLLVMTANSYAAQAGKDDAKRNEYLTTFRKQMRRGADVAQGEKGAILRDRMDKYPTVKGTKSKVDKSVIEYHVEWKAWPEESDEAVKAFRAATAKFLTLAGQNQETVSEIIGAACDILGIKRQAMVTQQKEDALDHIDAGDMADYAAAVHH